jgi:hypothetical protein
MITIRENTADLQQLNAAINQLARDTGQTIREVLPDEMRLLAVELAKATFPEGKDKSGNIKTMEKVKGRIMSVYPPPGGIVKLIQKRSDGAGGKLAGYMENRQWSKAQKLINQFLPALNITIGTFDGGALHASQKRTKRITRRLLVTDYRKVESYIKTKQRLVGFAKGGFAAAAKQLGGTRGIPGWATRQKSPGVGTVSGTGVTLTVSMENLVRHLPDALPPFAEKFAVKGRSIKLAARLKRIQDNKVRKAMRGF